MGNPSPKGGWKKGQSGNPKGKPKGPNTKRQMQILHGEKLKQAFYRLSDMPVEKILKEGEQYRRMKKVKGAEAFAIRTYYMAMEHGGKNAQLYTDIVIGKTKPIDVPIDDEFIDIRKHFRMISEKVDAGTFNEDDLVSWYSRMFAECAGDNAKTVVLNDYYNGMLSYLDHKKDLEYKKQQLEMHRGNTIPISAFNKLLQLNETAMRASMGDAPERMEEYNKVFTSGLKSMFPDNMVEVGEGEIALQLPEMELKGRRISYPGMLKGR
jgi:hypothetical protein